MSVLASLALAASTATLPHCSWDKPGANPFMGDVVAAVDRYQDIPAAVRAQLKARMQVHHYDEIVAITRDGIQGQARYDAEIRDMHFGPGTVCRTVSRSKWTNDALERGLVYCEEGHCILVPTICRNVSRITRVAPKPPIVAAAEPAFDPQGELEMEPPGAGIPTSAPTAANPSFAQLTNPQPTSIAGLPRALPSPIPGGFTPLFTPGVPTLPPGLPTTTPPIPEPDTWAMLLAGLATVAWLAKRRGTAG